MGLDVNDHVTIAEKLAYINGYLRAIEILNSTSDFALDLRVTDIGEVRTTVIGVIKGQITFADNSFDVVEISDWQSDIEEDCFYFFSNILEKVYGYFEDHGAKVGFAEKHNISQQLKYFICLLEDLFSPWHIKTVLKVEFGRDQCDYVFEIEPNRVICLHLAASDS